MQDIVGPTFYIYFKLMELWHVMNRAVDGKEIFVDSADCVRFVHDLYEFNDANYIGSSRRSLQMSDIVSPTSKRKKLVEIHGWVLNKNHYHLLLSEKIEGGISLFLRKLNIGYAKYFNEKYGRTGTLFQGRTKKVQVLRHAQFLYILHYIHLNALDQLKDFKEWRLRDNGHVGSVREALAYLDTYRWSSYMDYSGKQNFPSILTTSLFKNKDVFIDYRKSVAEYLKEIEIEELSGLTLE